MFPRFTTLPKCQTLFRILYIANEDDSIRVDARSFLGLFALDYSKPLKVITDSLYAMRMLEIQQRNRAAHMARA